MSELDELRRDNAELRRRNEQLAQSRDHVVQSLEAFTRGEVDAVVGQGGAVLLRAAQTELRDNRQLLRAIFDSALDAIMLADDDGTYVDANPAACKLFGLPREQLLGRSFADFATPGTDGRAGFHAFRELGHMVGVFPIQRLDGTTAMLDFSAVANVIPGRHLSMLRDISDRLAAEQALQRNEAMFRAVIEKSSEMISLTTADGVTRYLTPSAWTVLGWSPDEIGDRTLRDQVIPEDRVRIAAELERLMRTGERDMALEIRVAHRDGTLRWVEAFGTNLLDDPNVAAIVGNYRDITARKQADAELRASRDRLEEAQALAHIGNWTTRLGADDPIIWSPECNRIFGIAPGTIVTKPLFFSRLPEPDRTRMHGAIAKLAASRQPQDVEHRVQRPDGSVRWVLSRAMLERDEAGQPTCMIGTIQDVTDRHEAFTAVTASEQQYRRIVDNTSEGVYIYDPSGTIKFANEQLAKLIGTTLDQVPGRTVFDLLYASDHDKARAGIERRRLGIAERLEIRLRRDDGSPLWGSLQVNPLFTPEGVFDGGLVLVTDISMRRAADDARSLLAAIIESSDEAIVSIGPAGLIETWNRSATQLYQYTSAEAVGSPIAMLFTPAAHDTDQRLNSSAMSGEPFETSHVRKDGSIVEVVAKFSAVVDAENIVIATKMMTRDLTATRATEQALRRTQEQYRQAQKMEAVGRLAGGVAHDFNNLLSVILSYSQFAIEDLKPGDPLRDDMIQIDTAGKRASELTKQLLAFSRQQVLQPRVVDINTIIQPLERMLRRLLGEDVALALFIDPTIGNVVADPGQFEQVVMNLAVNARDAMPLGGSLTIETSTVYFETGYAGGTAGIPPGDYVMLAVSDTGTGMDEKTRAQIFEPFFTTKEQGKGTGLGLSTVFGIVRQSQGYIGVYSELGHGTTFKVYLPMTDRPADANDTDGAPVVLHGSETILVVEDEDQVRAVACAILRRNGYTVLEASNGGEAFLISKDFAQRIDLLLTDVVMPRISGRKLAEELVVLRPEIKVLYASGYTDDAIIHHGVLEAGVAFIQKPFTPDALLRRVREVLG